MNLFLFAEIFQDRVKRHFFVDVNDNLTFEEFTAGSRRQLH